MTTQSVPVKTVVSDATFTSTLLSFEIESIVSQVSWQAKRSQVDPKEIYLPKNWKRAKLAKRTRQDSPNISLKEIKCTLFGGSFPELDFRVVCDFLL